MAINNVVGDILSRCALYQQQINEVVSRKFDSDELSPCEEKWKEWNTTKDKATVNDYFSDDEFKAIYSQFLFRPRIRTMLNAFTYLILQPTFQQVLASIKSVVSIGCGPGPEIAATLAILRLGICVRHHIDVLGVDMYQGWSDYVLGLGKVKFVGCTSDVRFLCRLVHENNVDSLKDADLCVMSYTDAAMHTERFWRKLKEKFRVILILDQRKGKLKNALISEGYNIVDYQDKKVLRWHQQPKRFFYWVSDRARTEDPARSITGFGGHVKLHYLFSMNRNLQ